jgi:Xaa-Pro dipeptidase
LATNLVRLGPTPPPSWGGSDRVAEIDGLEGLPFDESEYIRRRARIVSDMEAQGVDALLVFRPSSVEWTCGYYTIAAEPIPIPLLVLPDRTTLCLLEFEAGRAVVGSYVDEVLYHSRAEDGLELLVDRLAESIAPGATVGIEMAHRWVPASVILRLQQHGLRLVDAPLAERARLVLSEAEIAYMREAGKITGAGIEAAIDAAKEPDATDATIAAAIAETLTRNADSLCGLDPVVAAGWAGGVPHSSWGARPINRSLPIVLEFSGARHRYVAPVMRTLAYEPLTGEAARLDELARHSRDLLLAELRVGRRCSDVARAVTEGLGEIDPWVVFHYVYGYPVGLSHPPTWMDGFSFYLSEQNDGLLETGMAFHCPASFRSFGRLGVCFSNTVVIQEDGPEIITPTPADVIYL